VAIPLPDLKHAALLSMDLHSSIISIYTAQDSGFTGRVAGILSAARAAGMCVIHVKAGFRPGLPEVSERNALFAAVKASPQWQQLFSGEGGAIHPAAAPQGDEIVITKHRGSAFTGTDLEMILRANGIETLVLMGIATSGVVLATLLHAADTDYRLVVVKDCCADRDPDLHAALIDRYFPRMATVIDAARVCEALATR
jgi:nicotinamidase-related amidase